MAATKRKIAAGAKAGKTSPRFGTPEWRKKHGLPVKAAAKGKATKAKAKK